MAGKRQAGEGKQVGAVLQSLDLLNAQVGVTTGLLITYYHRQRQREAQRGYGYPQGGYPQSGYPAAYPGYQPQPNPYYPQAAPAAPYPAQPPGYPPVAPAPVPAQAYPPPPAPVGTPAPYGVGQAGQGVAGNSAPMSPAPAPAAPAAAPAQGQAGQQPARAPVLVSLSRDMANLSEALTQVQIDLFEMAIMVNNIYKGQDVPAKLAKDKKVLGWLKGTVEKIKAKVPQTSQPLMPIGNRLACNFYLAKVYCQQAKAQTGSLLANPPEIPPLDFANQKEIINTYLERLNELLFFCFRWGNVALREKEWPWQPKPAGQQGGQQSGQAPGGQAQASAVAPTPAGTGQVVAEQVSPGQVAGGGTQAQTQAQLPVQQVQQGQPQTSTEVPNEKKPDLSVDAGKGNKGNGVSAALSPTPTKK